MRFKQQKINWNIFEFKKISHTFIPNVPTQMSRAANCVPRPSLFKQVIHMFDYHMNSWEMPRKISDCVLPCVFKQSHSWSVEGCCIQRTKQIKFKRCIIMGIAGTSSLCRHTFHRHHQHSLTNNPGLLFLFYFHNDYTFFSAQLLLFLLLLLLLSLLLFNIESIKKLVFFSSLLWMREKGEGITRYKYTHKNLPLSKEQKMKAKCKHERDYVEGYKIILRYLKLRIVCVHSPIASDIKWSFNFCSLSLCVLSTFSHAKEGEFVIVIDGREKVEREGLKMMMVECRNFDCYANDVDFKWTLLIMKVPMMVKDVR